MEFGLQFFPDLKPEERSPADYYRDCLDLSEAADTLGYTHVRTVEHHFHYYGGYSPSPIVFLAAAAQRTKVARLITGAVIPAFNHPLKVAGELAMLDGLSGGRLEVGFARAFLPREFRAFGISPDESIARFKEGLEQIDALLREENVTRHGAFHSFDNITTFPRPMQKPRPKFYVAATMTKETFEYAGQQGHSIMAIPMAADKLRESLDTYRAAYRAAGHPGRGEVMLAFHMFVDPDGERARRIAGPQIEAYFRSIKAAASEWTEGATSTDYKGYDKMMTHLNETTLDSLIASGSAWVGTPSEVCATIERLQRETGGFEHASMQVMFHLLPKDEGQRSMELFASEVLPKFSGVPSLA